MSGSATYVITAYRWGMRDSHSYVVGAVDNLSVAKRLAEDEVRDRGGKYGCEVWSATVGQVYYVESPHFRCARQPGSCHPADVHKPIEAEGACPKCGIYEAAVKFVKGTKVIRMCRNCADKNKGLVNGHGYERVDYGPRLSRAMDALRRCVEMGEEHGLCMGDARQAIEEVDFPEQESS